MSGTERERHHIPGVGNMVENTTNHDAVPDARARDADRVRTDKATARPGDSTGNTPAPTQQDHKRSETGALHPGSRRCPSFSRGHSSCEWIAASMPHAA